MVNDLRFVLIDHIPPLKRGEKNTSQIVQNGTLLGKFYLKTLNLSDKEQLVVFIGVLLMYLMSVLGNVIIVALVSLESPLHTPMYLFLCSLSVQDIIYVSAILPKLLAITITGDTSITFSGCMTQIFLFTFCVDSEFFLLTSMAYDRYVAICVPLHYPLIISKKVCALFITVSWLGGFLNACAFSLIVSHLTFCNKQEINNFFCDPMILMKLTCSDITYIMTLFVPVETTVLSLLPFTLIMISYICIISTILKIRSSSGRLKTFSSCSSHLTVVLLFYGTCVGLNLKPKSENSLEIDKLFSMIYIGVVPMLDENVINLSAIIDSGTCSCFLDVNLASQLHIPIRQKKQPSLFHMVDGSTLKTGPVTQESIPSGALLPRCLLYRLSEPETKVLKEYIEESLVKGCIHPSTFHITSRCRHFFVGKKDDGLQACVDYRTLNDITIKKFYPLPLISKATG
ncbi:olfactory receptor 1496-like [Bombina bombina]|uniref:olfactory receptor 1496-like n=1 Tax=Bombina bombina TaxID=8345 RepID=UPI00235A62A1|nr:olfactory receptor 1496-like [Bombina bombina]